MSEVHRINLQLFADSPIPGDEPDEPNEPDTVDGGDQTEPDTPDTPDAADDFGDDDEEFRKQLRELLGDDDDGADDDDGDPGGDAESDGDGDDDDDGDADDDDADDGAYDDAAPDPAGAEPPERTFTQEQVNQIVQERLARTKYQNEKVLEAVQALEAIHGKSLDQILASARQQQVNMLADEYGIDPQEAMRIVQDRERLTLLEKQEKEHRERLAQIEAQTKYLTEKQEYLAKHPDKAAFVRKYEREIDQVANGGEARVDFEVALAFVLGQKLLDGEVIEDVKRQTEQKVLRNVQKRQKAKPVGTGGAGSDPTAGLTAFERRMAKEFGLTPQEVAAEKRRLARERGRR